jgi:transposase
VARRSQQPGGHPQPQEPQAAVSLRPGHLPGRNIAKRTFCRLKDFRRLATRYDRLDETFISTVCIAAAIAYFVK